MKKEYKIIFLSALFILIFLSLINFVAAIITTESPNAFAESLKRPIDEFINSWQTGIWGEGLGKVFLGLLILFLIWGIFDATGVIENGWINFFIGLTIAFLSVAYLLPSEIVSLMQTYSALGLTLGVIIPFFVMALLTYGVVKSGSGFGLWIQKIFWVIFTLFLWYRLYISLSKASGFVSIIIAIVSIFCLLAILFNKQVIKSINNSIIRATNVRTREFQARVSSTERGRAAGAPPEGRRGRSRRGDWEI